MVITGVKRGNPLTHHHKNIMESNYPPVMTATQAAKYLAGTQEGGRACTDEFRRFVEKFGIEPIDQSGFTRNRDIVVRSKYSRKHIDLCLLTGLPFKQALEWVRQSPGVTNFC